MEVLISGIRTVEKIRENFKKFPVIDDIDFTWNVLVIAEIIVLVF